MKKALTILILIACAYHLKAQQLFKSKPMDSLSKGLGMPFNLNPSNRTLLLPPLANLNKWHTVPKINDVFENTERFNSRMPVVVLQGNSKMPVMKLPGNSRMPILPLNAHRMQDDTIKEKLLKTP